MVYLNIEIYTVMTNSKIKILLVDDDPDILEIVGYNLRNSDYQVVTAENGLQAIEFAKKEIPQLIILDVMMPKMDGIEACEEIRKIPALSNTIITFLTARSEDYSQMAGFEAGADDYITKPIRPKVLLSKVKALLRRLPSNNAADTLIFDDLSLNLEEHKVTKNQIEINLPRKEFKLLTLLCSKPNKVFTRDEILNSVWGSEVVVGDRTIDVHIRKLREKIGGDYFKTVKGVGYKFVTVHE